MPLHEVGYRAWPGKRTLAYFRWLTVASTGIRLVWRGTMLRRTIFFTWLPALFLATGFLFYEQASTQPESQRELLRFLGRSAANGPLGELLQKDIASARHDVWATLLMTFFRYPQAFVMVLMVGMIAPRAISFDLRSKAYLLYFSRPLTVWEYILGKSVVIWFYLGMVTTLPACLMYVLGLLLSPEWSVITITWDLPLRILAASLVLVIPTTSLALAFSALTHESRYAAFAWIATWVIGAVSYGVLTAASTASHAIANPGTFTGRRSRGGQPMSPEMIEITERWEIVSLYHVLGRVQQWVFGLSDPNHSIVPFAILLVVVTVGSLAIIHWRITSRLKS